MKKSDIAILGVLLAAALTAVIFFLPNKREVCVKMLAHTIGISVQSSQKAFVSRYLSLGRLLQDEVGNPLAQTPAVEPTTDLTKTDADIVKRMEKAQKNAASKKVAGKVVERTIDNMSGQVSAGNVKVQNRTDKKIDIPKILQEGAALKIADKSKPTVLIYHSHTHECYVTLDNGTYLKGETTQSADKGENVVRVGDAIVEQLEAADFGVIHDTSVHDEDYNHSYENAGKTIDKILKENPSIEVTIDIHRDSVEVAGDKKARTALVREMNGKKAAQIMIISGCEENFIKDFPHWYDNLHFALGLQQQLSNDYPGLARPLYFADRKYDMYKTKNSVLIEVGCDGNTLEQAVYAGKLVGQSLARYLEQYCVQ